MKTQIEGTPKEVFKDREAYLQFIKNWKQVTKTDVKLRAEHYLLYAILRNKDWRKCFTPCKNSVKLNNGAKPHDAAFKAMYEIFSNFQIEKLLSPFKDTLTKEMLVKVRTYVFDPNAFSFGKRIPDQPYRNAHGTEIICPSAI
jgi:(p)ppGpp synthase/HD superfamily hydrolase